MTFSSDSASAWTLSELSEITRQIADALRDEGIEELMITAGSAPALLDHVFQGAPIVMRDFDLAAIAHRDVDRDLGERIGRAVDSDALKFLPRYLFPRDRWHPREPSRAWRAGWGLLWDAGGKEVDLSIYHSREAHDCNGLLDIHRVRIPVLQPDSQGRDIFEQLCSCADMEEAGRRGLVQDPWNGYRSWRKKSAQIIAWEGVRLRPIECSIRILRDGIMKLGWTKLDPEIRDGLRKAIRRGTSLDTRYLDMRNLLKLLTDDRAALELEMLADLGAFDRWLQPIGALISSLGSKELHARFQQARPAEPRVHARLREILSRLRPPERDPILREVAVPESALARRVAQELQAA